MILQLGLQIGLPLFLLVSLWRSKLNTRWEWFLNTLAASAAMFFVFLSARWDFTSYYLRFMFPILLVPAAYFSYRRIIQLPEQLPEEDRRTKPTAMLTNAVVLLIFAVLCGIALTGYVTPVGALDLASPLRDATYYVGGGGNNRFINNHQAHEPQKFALDIVRLNALGNRAAGLAPDTLEQYAIFGDTVYSPCPGTIIHAVDGLPDQRPSQKDNSSLAGNHVVIDHEGVEIVLAHLKQGTVTVKAGDTVSVGDVLGQVGNSGNTSQPHLHLHAERAGEYGRILDGDGVPIKLNGRFLVRNSLFTGH